MLLSGLCYTPVATIAPQAAVPVARNAGACTLTRATDDASAVTGWLQRHLDSPHTLASYRREAERLLLWCAARQTTLQRLSVEDLVEYLAFLLDPQPVERWCLQTEPRVLADGSPNPTWKQVRRITRNLPDGSPNPAWKPFVSGLSESAARQASTILFGMMEYLCGIGFLAANPLRAVRKREPRKPAEIERYFERELWDWVLDRVEQLPQATEREIARYQRIKFLLSFMYLMGLRISEMAAAKTTDLVHKRGQWWLFVRGKGKKEGLVPIPQDGILVLKMYRESLGRSAWPHPDLCEPLVMDITGQGRELGSRAIHHILVTFFEDAANHTQSPEHAQVLRQASAHWLRHTDATHQIEAGVPLIVVRDNLRHSSVQTTEGYVHANRDRQHRETEKHQLRKLTPGI